MLGNTLNRSSEVHIKKLQVNYYKPYNFRIALQEDSSAPPEVFLSLLNLTEFLEHTRSKLPDIDIKNLGHSAEKCSAYAKVRIVSYPHIRLYIIELLNMKIVRV